MFSQLVSDVEWVSVDRRTFAGIIISLDVSLGCCILPAIAYCVREWRMLILAVTSPLLLSVIAWRYSTFLGVFFTLQSQKLSITPARFHWVCPLSFLHQVAAGVCTVALSQWEGRRSPSVHLEMCGDEQQSRAHGGHHAWGAFKLFNSWNDNDCQQGFIWHFALLFFHLSDTTGISTRWCGRWEIHLCGYFQNAKY